MTPSTHQCRPSSQVHEQQYALLQCLNPIYHSSETRSFRVGIVFSQKFTVANIASTQWILPSFIRDMTFFRSFNFFLASIWNSDQSIVRHSLLLALNLTWTLSFLLFSMLIYIEICMWNFVHEILRLVCCSIFLCYLYFGAASFILPIITECVCASVRVELPSNTSLLKYADFERISAFFFL